MKTTIDMAREAGAADIASHGWTSWVGTQSTEFLKRFEALVRADEAEQIAKMCETHIVWVGRGKRGLSELQPEELRNDGTHQGMDYAAAIRNRGNT
jgi:hypothetical protein